MMASRVSCAHAHALRMLAAAGKLVALGKEQREREREREREGERPYRDQQQGSACQAAVVRLVLFPSFASFSAGIGLIDHSCT